MATETTQPHNKGWLLYTHNIARDGKLWLWVICLLFVSRVILIWMNRHSISEGLPIFEFVKAFYMGLRFDITIATISILPSFLLASIGLIISTQKLTFILRSVMMYFFTITWVFITVITLAYFKEYHDQFNAYLLGLVYDDFNAIVLTIWQLYPVVWGALILMIICIGLIFIAKKWIQAKFPISTPAAPMKLHSRFAVGLLLLIVVFTGLRGH